ASGNLGRLYRGHASALAMQARGQCAEAVRVLGELSERPMPSVERGLVRLWKLSLLSANRQWTQAVEFYEQVDEWGMLVTMTQAWQQLARAHSLTNPRQRIWREAVAEQLQFAESQASAAALEGEAPAKPFGNVARREARPPEASIAAQTGDYAHGQEMLRLAQ